MVARSLATKSSKQLIKFTCLPGRFSSNFQIHPEDLSVGRSVESTHSCGSFGSLLSAVAFSSSRLCSVIHQSPLVVGFHLLSLARLSLPQAATLVIQLKRLSKRPARLSYAQVGQPDENGSPEECSPAQRIRIFIIG